MNDTMKSIFERSSTRAYTGEAVSPEMIKALKEAALASPTADNDQENRFIFVTDKNLLAKINEKTYEVMVADSDDENINSLKQRSAKDIFYGAPLVILIYSQNSHFAYIDAGIAVQNLALAAHSLGLGSCINGMCRRAFYRNVSGNLSTELGFAEDEDFRIAIVIGHIAKDNEPHKFDYSHIREI